MKKIFFILKLKILKFWANYEKNFFYFEITKSNMLLPHHVTENGYIPATEYFIQKENQSNEIDFSKYPKIIHVVNEGEWLWKIARFYWGEDEDVMLNQVVAEMKINNDLFSEVIDIGDELIVPVRLEKLKKILKNDDLFEIYKSYVKYDAKTALNPDGIALEKPNSALIEETRNQIINNIRPQLDRSKAIDTFAFLVSYAFFPIMGAGLQSGIIYIKNDACYFLINVEGGIGFDLAAGFERVFGRGVEKMATAEDVEGLSFNASLGVFMFDEGLSFNYDKEEKKIGNKFIAHSIGYMPLGTSYLFSGHISIGYTFLFKIPIEFISSKK